MSQNQPFEFLDNLAQELNTQKNYSTKDPIYIIEERRLFPVASSEQADTFQWVNYNGEIASDEFAQELEDAFEHGKGIPSKWKKEWLHEEWVLTQHVHLTLKAAQNYLKGKCGSELGDSNFRLYVDSAHDNYELREIRRLLSGPLHQCLNELRKIEKQIDWLQSAPATKYTRTDDEIRQDILNVLRQVVPNYGTEENEDDVDAVLEKNRPRTI